MNSLCGEGPLQAGEQLWFGVYHKPANQEQMLGTWTRGKSEPAVQGGSQGWVGGDFKVI